MEFNIKKSHLSDQPDQIIIVFVTKSCLSPFCSPNTIWLNTEAERIQVIWKFLIPANFFDGLERREGMGSWKCQQN